MIRKGLMIGAMFAIGMSTIAQTAEKEWSIGLQGGTSHYSGEKAKEFYGFNDVHATVGIQASKYINPFFDFQMNLKHGQIDAKDFFTNLFDLNAQLKFKFANGKLLKENFIVAPYIFTG